MGTVRNATVAGAGNSLPGFIQHGEHGWYILVKVQPGAKKSELCGESDGLLRIRLNAPAVENKANIALLEFLAEMLGIRKNKLALASGEKSRIKRVLILPDANPNLTALC